MAAPTLSSGSVVANGSTFKAGRYQVSLDTPLDLQITPTSSGDATGQVKLTINWGDGKVQRLGDWYNVGQVVQMLHPYQYQGDYYVAVTATNAAGQTSGLATLPLRLTPQSILNQQTYRWSGLALPVSNLTQSFATIDTVVPSRVTQLAAATNVGDTFILVSDPSSFAVGASIVIQQPGFYLTAATVVEVDTNRVILDSALNEAYSTTATVTVKSSIIGRSTNVSYPDSTWAFPASKDQDLVRKSVFALLSVRTGELIMNSDVGCDLYTLLFDPDDIISMQLAYTFIADTITKWEPRVVIVSLTVTASPTDRDANQMLIQLVLRFADDDPSQVFDVSVPFSRLGAVGLGLAIL